MLSNKPYLIRAFYDWIVDSKCTPFIVINANVPRTKVPNEHVEDGQITLNISPEAIRELKIGYEYVDFRASFSGIVHIISAPMKSVLALYAQENGQGMFFDIEEGEAEDINPWDNTVPEPAANVQEPVRTTAKKEAKKRPSHLKLVE